MVYIFYKLKFTQWTNPMIQFTPHIPKFLDRAADKLKLDQNAVTKFQK